ncbi:MAG: phage portal protein [Myxococcales bacterium]|nr:phage portal protein [Myxococcales bacterium]
MTAATEHDSTLRSSGAIAIARSRDLAENFDYFKGFLLRLRRNVVGHQGIRFRSRALLPNGEPDEEKRAEISAAFAEWSKAQTCSVDGQLSLTGLQAQAVVSVARDGGIYWRLVDLPRSENRFALAIQPIEKTAIDFAYDRDLGGGRRIVMGVEFAARSRRPVAYHFKTQPNGNPIDAYVFGGSTYVRIPAREIIDLTMRDYVTQTHGLPWAVSTMIRARHLHGYEEAELIAARVAASKMGFWTTSGDDEYAGPEDEETGLRTMEAEPGLIDVAPKGTEFQAWDPQHPTTAFESFCKSMLRGFASGLGVGYVGTANDPQGTSFASGRVELISDRDYYREIQAWLASTALDRVFDAWFEKQQLTGTIKPSTAETESLHRLAHWQGRGWQWVDPLKDATAAMLEYGLGATTLERIVAERTGEEWADVMRQIARERKLAQELGIPIDTGGGSGDLFASILGGAASSSGSARAALARAILQGEIAAGGE